MMICACALTGVTSAQTLAAVATPPTVAPSAAPSTVSNATEDDVTDDDDFPDCVCCNIQPSDRRSVRGVLVHRSRRCLPPRPYTGEGQDDEGVAESSTVLTIILVMAAMVVITIGVVSWNYLHNPFARDIMEMDTPLDGDDDFGAAAANVDTASYPEAAGKLAAGGQSYGINSHGVTHGEKAGALESGVLDTGYLDCELKVDCHEDPTLYALSTDTTGRPAQSPSPKYFMAAASSASAHDDVGTHHGLAAARSNSSNSDDSGNCSPQYLLAVASEHSDV